MARRIELPDRWPLYSPLGTRTGDVPLDKDARLINGFVEFDPTDKQYWIYKRPGLSPNPNFVFTDGGAGGIYQSPRLSSISSLFSVTGSVLRQGTNVLDSFIDTSPVLGQPYLFETIASSPLSIVMMTPFSQFLISGSTVTKINSAIPATQPINLPNLVAGMAYLDGTLYVMDPLGNIWGSNINDASTWNPLNVIQADSNSDAGIAIAKQLNYVIAFKQNSTQVFFDNQNPAPGSPLSPVPDSQIPLGCCAPYSVQQIDNSLLWLSSNSTVSPQVVQMDNLIPKIVSTPSVERILDNVVVDNEFGGGGVSSWVFKHAGHRFYGLALTNLNITLVYDMDQQAWYVWTDTFGNSWPIFSLSYSGGVNTGISGPHLAQLANGQIMNIDSADIYPNDNGVLFPVDIYTANFDAGVDKEKVLNLLHFNADLTAGSILNARYNDNDYDPARWSNFRRIDLSQERPFIDEEGSFYRRAYHFRHMCNTPLRIKSGDLLLGLGVL